MRMQRSRNTGSSLPWYFSWMALTDSASMRAWAGSYTPHGRSQWAAAVTAGRNRRMGCDLLEIGSRSTLLPTAFPADGGFHQDGAVREALLPWQWVRVSGPSMVPTLRDGDRVVVR